MLHECLLTILYKYDQDAIAELGNISRAVKQNWDSDLHDTKLIASEVLEQLGETWKNDVIVLAKAHLDEMPPLPSPGKNRTRMFKYMIKDVLDILYKNDVEFRFYKKYNPPKSIYITWKKVEVKKQPQKKSETKIHRKPSQVRSIANRIPDIFYNITLPSPIDDFISYLEDQLYNWMEIKPREYKKSYCELKEILIKNVLYNLRLNKNELSLHIYAISELIGLDEFQRFPDLSKQIWDLHLLNDRATHFYDLGYKPTEKVQINKAIFQENFKELNEEAYPDDHIIPNLWEAFTITEKEVKWLQANFEAIRKTAQRDEMFSFYQHVTVWPAYYRLSSILENYKDNPSDIVLAIHPYEAFCFEPLYKFYRDSIPKKILKAGVDESEFIIPRNLGKRFKEQFSIYDTRLKEFLSSYGHDTDRLKVISYG